MVSRFMRLFGRKSVNDDCLEVREKGSDFIDGELDSTFENRIRAHLAQCGPCNSFINTLRATVGLLRGTPKQKAPEDFRERLQQRLSQEKNF